ncbi:Putative glycosyltransferase EpsE [Aquisphaera giovannonii]|uniref:Glycosyltransferase EpsE n=1 Tax=Aquisphaera giovannonii TaxID=406548 RepID=A0A5B9W941_9BACT|nr:glycosyltransferase [Aquisphaera giovannonii]QEH36390.1 Putative glycosyltransferase EpsE [Aquisphaera giovannonii]
MSVLMPVYNTRRYVRQAVESILGQTFEDFELIVMDDQSTDGSLGVVEECRRRDDRVRLFPRAKTGYCRLLNEALGLARGRYLARMDSDDVSLPDRFEKQVAYLEANSDCVAVGCRVREIDPHGLHLDVSRNELDHDGIVARLLEGAGAEIPHPGVMMRTSAVVEAGGYRPEFEPVEDLDLYLRLAERGRLANLPGVLLEYRQHFTSVNYLRADEQVRLASLVVAEAMTRRGQAVPGSFAVPPWRMPTKAESYRNWAEAALRSRRRGVAMEYAVKGVMAGPAEGVSWVVLAGVLAGTLRSFARSARDAFRRMASSPGGSGR